MSDELLKVEDLHVGYGRGDIVKGIDLVLRQGEVVTIIGPNGAGKSTFIKALGGAAQVSRGKFHLRDHGELTGLRASQMSSHGIAYVPQEGNIFRSLTVAENLQMGGWTSTVQLASRIAELTPAFPVLAAKRTVLAGNLSGGERQMVALAMALISRPRVLLLDEPSAGLSPKLVGVMFETIRNINAGGVSVLMVEQNAREALRISDRGYVFAGGRVQLEDRGAALLDDARVAELYLGMRG